MESQQKYEDITVITIIIIFLQQEEQQHFVKSGVDFSKQLVYYRSLHNKQRDWLMCDLALKESDSTY